MEIRFSVRAATAVYGTEVRVVGAADALGRWNPEHGAVLRTEPGQYPCWSASVRMLASTTAVDYKFVKVLPNATFEWEDGPNRLLLARSSGPALAGTP
eukprot:CAMPEP_0183444598 /NCGR_PEP_ID=MMETSP0370-20130417/95627_1 /TAXON_ID=268820 /ORGANISM="Peridinium aciculiferum, Strain PAER-2" /LENGTH=97 /DNA_ID=CAMNT_0025635013 /DNA_START=137 /DNA_END=426 /DNA_ORIENTATION=-